MTTAEITALQQALNSHGYPIAVDGRYGPITQAAYAAFLDQDVTVPTFVPPAAIPWWQSKTALFTLATIAASIAGLLGVDLDKQTLAETLGSAVTLVTGVLALWANARRTAPIDRSLVAPGLRLPARAPLLPAPGQPTAGDDVEHGPFGF